MKKCPKCKKEFSKNVQFCPVCGYEDYEDKENSAFDFFICPQCKIEYSYKIDHCTHCGYSTNKYKEKMKSLQNEKAPIKEKFIPRCPTCNSPNIRKISSTEKMVDIGLFGILGTIRKKQFHCNLCGYEW